MRGQIDRESNKAFLCFMDYRGFVYASSLKDVNRMKLPVSKWTSTSVAGMYLSISATYYRNRRLFGMIKDARELPQPGFTIPELEHLLGYQRKSLYPSIRKGTIKTYHDSTGVMRVGYADAVLFAKWRLQK